VKIEGQYTIAAPQQTVWDRLNDPEVLAKSLPGVDKLESTGPDSYKAKIKYKMGPVSGTFDGTVELSEKNPPNSMRLKTSARGGPGFVNGDGKVELTAKGDETEIRYSGEVQLGGMLAAVGSRMLEGAAKKSIEEFFQSVVEQK
jgi:carbon monoxide dehydrogenase subunit G